MKRVATWLGWVLLVIGGILLLLGWWTWPPGGLFFALPYFFLIPGVPSVGIGALLILLGRRGSPTDNAPPA